CPENPSTKTLPCILLTLECAIIDSSYHPLSHQSGLCENNAPEITASFIATHSLIYRVSTEVCYLVDDALVNTSLVIPHSGVNSYWFGTTIYCKIDNCNNN
ncbi:hypothetical protein PENTCL1PPCAC_19661, partial [Pristionchus entomophagus]